MDLQRLSSGCGESDAALAEPSLTVRQQIFRWDAAQRAQVLVCSTPRITGVQREKSGKAHIVILVDNIQKCQRRVVEQLEYCLAQILLGHIRSFEFILWRRGNMTL
jgi:hypothetical protein